MACTLTSPAGRILGRPARYCPGPSHSWKSLPGPVSGQPSYFCPPRRRLDEGTAAAAAAGHRTPLRAVVAEAAAAAAPAATAASCKACCGAGASGGAGAAGAGAAAAAAAGVFGLSAGTLFGASSVLMVPVYGMMAFFPRAMLTRALLLNSSALYVGLALLYGAVLAGAWQAGLGAALGAVAGSIHSAVTAAAGGGFGGLAAVDLSPLARMFSSPLVTLASWLHLLALDALMARDIALDGIRSGTPTAHSVLLCFFFGPTGLLSHAVTRLLLRGGK